jgi:hypothetical protein
MAEKRGQYKYQDDGTVAQLVSGEAEVTTNEVIPVDVQARLSQTIQTHSGASIVNGTGSFGTATWIDCDGFSEIAITFLNSGATASVIDVDWSNDNATLHGRDSALLPSATQQWRTGETKVKARYCRLNVFNGHTAPITANVWVLLKA